MVGDTILKDGSRVAIIGGGPAGSFFVHFASRLAGRAGIRLSLTIFDGKDFLQRGPKGCNLCAGVVARSLEQKMEEEGFILPKNRIVSRVDGYSLHLGEEPLVLMADEGHGKAISTVFRGNGPRYSSFPDTVSFDDYLLHLAQDEGATVISHAVWEIKLPKGGHGPIQILHGQKKHPDSFEADLVVGAFGINSHLAQKIRQLGFGYRPPRTLVTFQAEVKLGREEVFKKFGNTIHVYMPKSRILRYATVIPKGNYISVTLIGKKNATEALFYEFLQLKEIRGKGLALRPNCACFPRIAVSPARRPYADRLVLVGDAGYSRHYKNGLESAFLTASLAAEAAFFAGTDRAAFASAYGQPAGKLIVRDNRYGRLLFFIRDRIASSPLLAKAHLSIGKDPGYSLSCQKLKKIIWNMFTGETSYRRIFWAALDIRLQISLWATTLKLALQKLKKILIPRPSF